MLRLVNCFSMCGVQLGGQVYWKQRIFSVQKMTWNRNELDQLSFNAGRNQLGEKKARPSHVTLMLIMPAMSSFLLPQMEVGVLEVFSSQSAIERDTMSAIHFSELHKVSWAMLQGSPGHDHKNPLKVLSVWNIKYPMWEDIQMPRANVFHFRPAFKSSQLAFIHLLVTLIVTMRLWTI